MDSFNLTGVVQWFINLDWMKILLSVLLFVVGIFVASILRRLVYKIAIRFFPEPSSRNIARVVYYIIVFVFGVVVLGFIGIDLTGVIVAGGIIGIILGFALQNLVANLFSGLFLYWEKPFRPGDLVDIGGILGRVTDITALSTKILGLDGVKTRIPNQMVFQSNIKNYSATRVRRLDFVIGIAYREDAEKAYRVIQRVLDEHPLVLVDPPPDIYVYELGDSSVNIQVRVWVPSKGMIWYEVLKDLLWKMKKAITDAGIEIPFIQNDVWFRTPLRIKIEASDSNDAKSHKNSGSTIEY